MKPKYKIRLMCIFWVSEMILAASCSMKNTAQSSYNISVALPVTNAKSLNLMDLISTASTSSNNNNNFAIPQAITDFRCYGLNVSAVDIPIDPRFQCTDPRMGSIFGLATASGGVITASVPSGSARTIQLIGVQTAATTGCPDIGTLISNGHVMGTGNAYLLGSTKSDIFSDTSVSISVSQAGPYQQAFNCDSSPSTSTSTSVGEQFVGVSLAANSKALTLGPDSSSSAHCDGSVTNCVELDGSWTPEWSSLTTYYKMNESAGTYGANSTLTLINSKGTGTTTWGTSGIPNDAPLVLGSSGKLNTSLQFSTLDSTSVYWSNSACLVGTSDPIPNTSSFSVALWFFPKNYSSATDPQTLIASPTVGLDLYYDSNLKSIYLIANGYQVSQSGIMVNQWNHIVLTYSNINTITQLFLYVNGVINSSSQSLYTGQIPLPNSVTLGCLNNSISNSYPAPYNNYRYNNYTYGLMDDLAFWSTVLSPAEVQTLYNRQAPGIQGNYGGYYLSPILDSGNASTDWSSFSWVSALPYGKPLPDQGQSESVSSYSALATSSSSTGSGAGLMSGIVGLWHLDGSFNDTSGHGFNGTIYPNNSTGINSVPGKFNLAASFNGTSSLLVDYSSTSSDFSFSNTTPFTISAWVNPSAYSGTAVNGGNGIVILDKGAYGCTTSNSCNSYGYNFAITSTGQLAFNFSSNGSASQVISVTSPSSDLLQLNQWQHVVVTFNGSYIYLYINDVQVQSNSISSMNANANAAPLYIGGGGFDHSSSNYFYGAIDEVAIWSRALSSIEVMQLYQRGATRIKFQIRTCSDAACANTLGWMGPDGSGNTYFSELNNNSVQGWVSGYPAFGSVLPGSPMLGLASFFPGSPSWLSNEYIQYRAIFESDQEIVQGSTSIYSAPVLQSVTLTPQ